jgi:hypothetical protein
LNENKFYVYEHWRPDRDECFYVGKGKGRRANNLDNRNIFHKAIQGKLARLGMAVEVRMVQVGLSEGDAFALEIERIAFWRAARADLANVTDGGEGMAGVPAHNRRSVLCLETGKLFPSATHAGKSYGLGVTAVSDICREKYRSADGVHFVFSDQMHDVKERQRRILDIEKRLAVRRKRVLINKQRDRGVVNGLDRKGRHATGPMRLARRIICIDDGRQFSSASEAGRHYNISISSIIKLCLGKHNRKSAGGLVFKYEDA